MKYTDEQIKEAVQTSISVAEVVRKLGVKYISGSMQTHISRRIKKLNLNTLHFKGKRANSGQNHKGGPDKKHWQEILILSCKDTREESYRLRRAMIESGMEYQCSNCEMGPTWRGKELRLQINHINGKCLDNRRENLEFLCPNCHSQTKGWSQSKGYTDVTSRAKGFRERRKRKSKSNGQVVEQ